MDSLIAALNDCPNDAEERGDESHAKDPYEHARIG